jgi:hypothetical protein
MARTTSSSVTFSHLQITLEGHLRCIATVDQFFPTGPIFLAFQPWAYTGSSIGIERWILFWFETALLSTTPPEHVAGTSRQVSRWQHG